jgi:general secretion pathway protein F
VPQFSYKAKSGPGDIKEDVVTAESRNACIKKLRQQGLYPISITETTTLPRRVSSAKINPKDITEFTRQLANLMHAGFSLPNALATLQAQLSEQKITKLIEELHDKVRKGASFSEALQGSPGIFTPFYTSMIKIGEASGKIDEALIRLADFRERERELSSRVKAALAYPAFILITGVGTVFFMITFFVPRLVTLFQDTGQELPLLTKIVIGSSANLQRSWPFLIVGILVAGIFARFNLRAIKPMFDRITLKTPVLKDVASKVEITRFTYGLSILLRNGVPMLKAVDVVGLNTYNDVYKNTISGFGAKIQKGQSLSDCLRGLKLFPPVLINMIAVGEESGELTQLLERAAVTFESEVNRSVNTLVSLLEPILILFVGSVVLILVFAMLMPVFQMNLLIR